MPVEVQLACTKKESDCFNQTSVFVGFGVIARFLSVFVITDLQGVRKVVQGSSGIFLCGPDDLILRFATTK